jgi:energy-coupling factor transporter transmembrane protein EcfT
MVYLGLYRHDDSFAHRLDPRVKILGTILLSILIFQAQKWEILMLSAFLSAVCLIARLKFAEIRVALKPLAWLAALLFGLHLFFTEGKILLQMPYLPVRITEEGLSRGLLISWQFLSLALSGIVLTMTTAPSELVGGLENLLSPLRRIGVPVQDIAVMVSLALRFVPTLLEEFSRIKTAQLARGAEWEKGRLDRRMKSMAVLLAPLLVSAFRRADDLAEAMETRGYARGPRTSLHQLRLGGQEAVALIALGFLLTLVLASKYYL